jgi:DNA-binding beta-propeller fold protein YncE
MALAGSGMFTYEMSAGWSLLEATAVAVASSDNVYVFNRGEHPVIVFDSDGNFLRSWGEGVFTVPHGVAVGPDGSIYCVDSGDHTVRKFTPKGELLMTIGEPGRAGRR